jgi:hypothetical protein
MREGGYDIADQLFMDARGIPITRFSDQDKADYRVLREALIQATYLPDDPKAAPIIALVAFVWARCTGRADVLLAIKESIEGEIIDGERRGVLGQIKAVIVGEFAGFAERLDAHIKESAQLTVRQRHLDERRVEVRAEPELTVGEIANAVIEALRESGLAFSSPDPSLETQRLSAPPAIDHEGIASATAERVVEGLKPHMGVHMDIAAIKESLRESFQLAWIWIALGCVLAAGGFGVWVGYRRASIRDTGALTVLSQQVADLKHANATLARVCVPGRR